MPASETGDFTACRLPNNVVLLPGIEPRYDAYPATLYCYSHTQCCSLDYFLAMHFCLGSWCIVSTHLRISSIQLDVLSVFVELARIQPIDFSIAALYLMPEMKAPALTIELQEDAVQNVYFFCTVYYTIVFIIFQFLDDKYSQYIRLSQTYNHLRKNMDTYNIFHN